MKEEADRLQASLRLEGGPLMRVAIFEAGGAEASRVLMVIHHLVVDGVSWRVLLEDLGRAYGQVRGGGEADLGRKTSSYRQWAEALEEFARGGECRGAAGYWVGQAGERVEAMRTDYEGGDNVQGSERKVRVRLSGEQTRRLMTEVAKAYGTRVNEALMSGLGRALVRWGGRRRVAVDVEGHGREEVIEGVDVSRTVGWFTTIYPVWVDAGEGEVGAGERIKRVKERMRRIPRRGIGYGVMRYLSEEEEVREAAMGMGEGEVSFNYLGQVDGVIGERGRWRKGEESVGEEVEGGSRRRYEVEVNAVVEGGMLEVEWSYSGRRMGRERMERMGERYVKAMRGLIEHCVRGEGGGYTPSDFPHADLSQQELDDFLSEISEFGD